MNPVVDLDELLKERFGLESFRGPQREVCEAVVAGRDALLVMPTGAGKSLCYQLPAVAREGCAVVISPLIALMEDQVGKLQSLGIRAERIHSGRARDESRAVCQRYLDGDLDLLFIAPERLSVPRFGAFLSRRSPALIAVDEAHCISQWGHDFRPDYRLLKDHLAPLRPAPVIALTATATRRVQKDISEQLGLEEGLEVIAGFRRENLGLELAEVRPGERLRALQTVLSDEANRPAIVYAPTRKKSEEAAAMLADDFPCAAYHAGLSTDVRDQVQARFLSGELEVIVATNAFGMGIDKADVRTVVHLAMPGSLEAYYQEIGRAGRDGERARAVTLFSWADRKLHEHFMVRDWPEVSLVERVFDAIEGEGVSPEEVARASRVDPEITSRALEHLVQCGAAVREAWGYERGASAGIEDYARQRAQREGELDDVIGFARSTKCRMAALVGYFGDRDDRASCGQCDACAPEGSAVRRFSVPTEDEARALQRIADEIEQAPRGRGVGSGSLFKKAGGDLDRDGFERYLGCLERAGLVAREQDAFEKDGQLIQFTRVKWRGLSPDLESSRGALLLEHAPTRGRGKARKRGGKKGSSRAAKPAVTTDALKGPLAEALVAWRGRRAKDEGVPAYRVLPNRTIAAIAESPPGGEDDLADIPGIGPAKLKSYGAEILEVVRGH
jgi:RecQ family ATP-dependent DNA helicase